MALEHADGMGHELKLKAPALGAVETRWDPAVRVLVAPAVQQQFAHLIVLGVQQRRTLPLVPIQPPAKSANQSATLNTHRER